MSETAKELIHRMGPDIDALTWSMEDVEIDLQGRYGTAMQDVGQVPFLAELFLTFGDSTLGGWLHVLDYVWKDLPFAGWKEVLHLVGGNAPAVYQLVWSAGDLLAIDMVRVIQEDSGVHPVARDVVQRVFPRGPPRTYSSLTREEVIPEIQPHWRRLAAEGAPMMYDMSQT